MNDATLITMTGITKYFPGVIANDNVDFRLFPGEIHTLLGENGAGKSTLINVLAGVYKPDAGTIEVRGKKVEIRSPYDSLQLGIGTVYQHFALIPTLSVVENIMLGFEGGIILSQKSAENRLMKLCNELGLSVRPREKVENLSVGERQRAEILKILFHGADALILDEPTSVLSPLEIQELFRTLLSLRKMGKGVVLITHKLNDAFEISDRITILKLGKNVAEMSGEKLREMGEKEASNKIMQVMFGDMSISEPAISEKKIENTFVLELQQVGAINSRGASGLKEMSFKIRKGEIFGVAGVDGNGQRSLCEVIGGQKKATSGKVIYNGRDITNLSPCRRFELGISYISDDRMNEGCALSMVLSENSILRNYYRPPFSRYGVINDTVVRSHTSDLIKRFNIKAPGPEIRIGILSGGNIQKFVLACGLSFRPKLIVCNKPTYGLDAKTVHYIQELLLSQSEQGTSVLLISADMDELLNYSDRIGVLFNGEMLDVLNRSDATPEKIGKLMLGIQD